MEASVTLGAYEARLLEGILGNALEQDDDDVAGDYFWFLLDDDVREMYASEDDSDLAVEAVRENYKRIREVLAGAREDLAKAAGTRVSGIPVRRTILVHLNVEVEDDRPAEEIAQAILGAIEVGQDDDSVRDLRISAPLAEEV